MRMVVNAMQIGLRTHALNVLQRRLGLQMKIRRPERNEKSWLLFALFIHFPYDYFLSFQEN
jgi:hypothetical protein